MPLFFVQFFLIKIHHYPKYKGIRARLMVSLATKINVINKGCNANAVRKAMLSSTELLGLGN
ncbi:MAG: hypothetical protein LBL39_04490 [Planctomycetaceae bacterium]|nr:hypothetical protein [Planctomycetaceae bacterium]